MGGNFNTAIFLLVLLYCTECFSEITDEEPKWKPCPITPGWFYFEKDVCLKISYHRFTNYAESESYCKFHRSYLLMVNTERKQAFVEKILKLQRNKKNTWLGLKYVNDNYQWTNGSDLLYSNWKTDGALQKDPKYCTQLHGDVNDPYFGKWSRVPCNQTQYLTICEKHAEWEKKERQKLQLMTINRIKNPIPVGFIYVQLPKQKPPSKLWPWMGWADISQKYNSTFFRVLGNDSAAFGKKQEQRSSVLEFSYSSSRKVRSNVESRKKIEVFEVPYGEDWSKTFELYKMALAPKDFIYMRFTMERNEFRPSNMAMIIWKRVY